MSQLWVGPHWQVVWVVWSSRSGMGCPPQVGWYIDWIESRRSPCFSHSTTNRLTMVWINTDLPWFSNISPRTLVQILLMSDNSSNSTSKYNSRCTAYSDGWCLCDFVWSILALHILCRTEVTDSHQLYSITVFSPAYCPSESRYCAGRHNTICKHSIGIYWLYIEASQNDVLPSTLEIWIGCAEKPKSCRSLESMLFDFIWLDHNYHIYPLVMTNIAIENHHV